MGWQGPTHTHTCTVTYAGFCNTMGTHKPVWVSHLFIYFTLFLHFSHILFIFYGLYNFLTTHNSIFYMCAHSEGTCMYKGIHARCEDGHGQWQGGEDKGAWVMAQGQGCIRESMYHEVWVCVAVKNF